MERLGEIQAMEEPLELTVGELEAPMLPVAMRTMVPQSETQAMEEPLELTVGELMEPALLARNKSVVIFFFYKIKDM